jgi:hypothetical protein
MVDQAFALQGHSFDDQMRARVLTWAKPQR